MEKFTGYLTSHLSINYSGLGHSRLLTDSFMIGCRDSLDSGPMSRCFIFGVSKTFKLLKFEYGLDCCWGISDAIWKFGCIKVFDAVLGKLGTVKLFLPLSMLLVKAMSLFRQIWQVCLIILFA